MENQSRTYYILPRERKTPTFREVQVFSQEQINREWKTRHINTPVNLVIDRGYTPFDDNTDFLWHSPEIESITFFLYDAGKNLLDLEFFDCDHLRYHPDVEEIMLESGLLTAAQKERVNTMQDHFFWRCTAAIDISDRDIKSLAFRQIFYSIAQLSDGVLFAVDGDWNMKVSPTLADTFFQQNPVKKDD